MYAVVLIVIAAAVVIAGCTARVQAGEKEAPLFVIDEQRCSGIIAVDVIDVQPDNRHALTAGLREVEKTHKIIQWEPKLTAKPGYRATSGYDVQVELSESCGK